MGDVFDAMNRAKQEKARREGQTPTPPDQRAPEEPPLDDSSPALPIDSVPKQTITDQPVSQGRLAADDDRPRPHHDTSVSAAMDRTQQEKYDHDRRPLHADTHPTRDDEATALPNAAANAAKLNGYSPQVVVHHDRGSIITEQYRAIRTQILARGRNRKLHVHCVTSSAPQEGKSVTCFNLGVAFSELRNQKTVIIEGDLRRPSFGKLLNRRATPGLIQLLRGEVDDLDQALHPTVYDNLQFIPAGDRDFTNSTELLSSPRMVQILDRLKDRYDHIFIDTPPVITVTDACILGALADETFLVVRLGKTPAEVVDRSKRLLRASNCDVSGVILTHMQYHIPQYLYRYV